MKVGNPVMWRSTGSAFMVTTKKWKDLTVMSGKSPGPGGIATPRVIAQRVAMATIVELGKLIGGNLYSGFREYNSKQTYWSAWVQNNVTPAFSFSSPGTATLVPEQVTAAKGSLLATDILSAVADESTNLITLTWPTTVNFGQSENDRIRGTIYNIDKDDWYAYVSGNTAETRGEGTGTLNTPDGFLTTGDEILIFAWFEGEPDAVSAGKNSDAVIVEATVVA